MQTATFPASPHIMLVEDHPIVRRGVRHILSEAFPSAVIEEAGLGSDAILMLWHRRWDVVILDLTLPDGSGLDVLECIRERECGLPVLILSMHPADQFSRRAMSGGASGYLTKDAADAELVTAVTQVVSGGTYVATPPPAAFSGPGPNARYDRLSNRERQVLQRLAQGNTVREIAVELAIDAKTVSTYRTRLLRKLDLRTNAEITRYVNERLLRE